MPKLKALYSPYTILSVLVLALAVVSLRLWLERQERFPFLEEGEYHGAITGLFDNPRLPTKFLVRKLSGAPEFQLVLLRPDWPAQIERASSPGDDSSTGQDFFPLIISHDGKSIKLSGVQNAPGSFSGRAVDQSNGQTGSWTLSRYRPKNDALSDEEQSELKSWLALRGELSQIDAQIVEMEELVPKQKEEIERLTEYVTEGVSLKRKADTKFNAVKEEIKSAKERLKLRQDEAKELEEKIDLSQRVTATGKLVSMSRDSLEREGRWIESMLKVNPGREEDSDLQNEVERAEKVLDLKRQIDLEKERISQLQNSDFDDEYVDRGR